MACPPATSAAAPVKETKYLDLKNKMANKSVKSRNLKKNIVYFLLQGFRVLSGRTFRVETKSYDGEKAWSSINHSIFFGIIEFARHIHGF
jgi:hypothetical protein